MIYKLLERLSLPGHGGGWLPMSARVSGRHLIRAVTRSGASVLRVFASSSLVFVGVTILLAACGRDEGGRDGRVLATTSSLMASCPPTGFHEVTIYEGANFTGLCRVLQIGTTPSVGDPDPIPTILSMQVGGGVRAAINDQMCIIKNGTLTICNPAGQRDYEGGQGYTGSPLIAQNGTSIIVQPNLGHSVASTYLGNYPSGRETFWTDDAQGIAHDGGNWFLTHNVWVNEGVTVVVEGAGQSSAAQKIGVVYSIPVSMDLGAAGNGLTDGAYSGIPLPPACPSCRYATLPSATNNQGYNHFGDPDVYGHYLFVPVEGPGLVPIVAAFDTRDLHFIACSPLPSAAPANQAAWLSVSSEGILYTSGNITATQGIYAYRVDTAALDRGQSFLTYLNMPWLLKDRMGNAMDLHNLQGGDLSPDGLLYLSNGEGGDGGLSGYGLRVFDVAEDDGQEFLQASADGAIGPFAYEIHPDFPDYQEPEGLDYSDVSGLGSVQVPDSQLHVLLYNNLDAFLSKGSIWLKHYRQNDPSVQAPPCGVACRPGTTCDYSLGPVAGEGQTCSVSCAYGSIASPSVTYGELSCGLVQCPAAASNCSGADDCSVFISNNICGADPCPGIAKAGQIEIQCPQTFVDIVGFANVDGDTAHRNDVVAVGRPGTAQAGYIFVGLAGDSGVQYWTWASPGRMVDDGAKIWLADVNNDGKADLVAQGVAGGAVAGWVVVGLSDGLGFAQWSWTSGQRMLDDGSNSWLADVDGDGKADLVTQGADGGAHAGWMSVGLSNGSGFGYWSWTSGHRMLDDGSKVWLADVDGDANHKADLVAQGPAGGGAAGWVVVGLSNGLSFAQWSWVSGHRMLDDGSNTFLADVNGDHKADLVTVGAASGPNPGWVSVGLSNGLSFPQWSWTSGYRMLDDGSKVWLADVNNDHMADLVAQGPPGGGAAGWVVLGLSNSAGAGFAHWSWTSGQRILDDSSTSWLADINGDGRADFITQTQQANTSGRIATSLSNGQSFASWTWPW